MNRRDAPVWIGLLGTLAGISALIHHWLFTPQILSMSVASRVQLKSLVAALEFYAADHDGRYPTKDAGLLALIEKPADDPNWKGPYLKDSPELPRDKWGSPIRYEVSESKSVKAACHVRSSGPDRLPETADDLVENPESRPQTR